MLIFVTPAGIGDISWIYSKISEIAKKRSVGIKIADWSPQRSLDFVNLLPNVKNLGYTTWQEFPKNAISISTDLESLEDGEYYVEANSALENGVSLQDIFPKQQTEFHYPLSISESHIKEATRFIDKISGWPKIGLYSSSYHDDKFWNPNDWLYFTEQLLTFYPEAAFYVIGADWDDRTRDIFDKLKKSGINAVEAVGQHKIGTTISVIKELDYLFAYPSGLGIMADVVDTPCLMWYWTETKPKTFLDTYADQKNVASNKHINILMCDVHETLKVFLNKGKKWIDINQPPLEVKDFTAAGGFGDALMVANKLKHHYSKSQIFLNFYTNTESAKKLIEDFLALQGIRANVLVDTDTEAALRRDSNIITGEWSGYDEKRKIKDVAITPFFFFKGEKMAIPKENYYILQTEAGISHSSDSKNWTNTKKLIQVAKKINSLFDLKAVIIGKTDDFDDDENFISTKNIGFGTLPLIQNAKFVLGLSSFVTLFSLMSRTPTILKKENTEVFEYYYNHPRWREFIVTLQDVDEELIISTVFDLFDTTKVGQTLVFELPDKTKITSKIKSKKIHFFDNQIQGILQTENDEEIIFYPTANGIRFHYCFNKTH